MNVVVVESPAKAKTINKYLGSDFTVLASFGHVRDLPPKDGSVRPDEDFAMDWELDGKGATRVSEIARAVKGARRLFLATDPDREGEAISWHVLECLADKKALRGVEVKRVVFHEVTKSAVLDAIANPRDINRELVDAYLARRALDYLVGFTLSPVLWRKLPGSKSAGRVQSVALRLICERENEIEIFRPQEYWSIDAALRTPKNEPFSARLTHFNGEKLDKLSLKNETAAMAAKAAVEAAALSVASVERKAVKRHPQPPFTTSTLQQEASRKLGFSASRTMQVAQRLYEGVDIGGETAGLITYMRTDGVTLSNEAIAATRSLIGAEMGRNYLPNAPRLYKTKAKNAQEAHEAIRPTDVFRKPADLSHTLERDQLRLYELIWKRTVACQMESAVLDQTTVDLADAAKSVGLRAVGTVIKFDGFLKLYQEGRDDAADDDESRLLPALNDGDAVKTDAVKAEQHFTQPPPRYSEASLVKKMEELGIGRPSTYASIIQVLQDRDYVRLEQKRFLPEDRGRVVTAFLSSFFQRYVEYGFTADLETQLDDISDGKMDWKEVLRRFWTPFIASIQDAKNLSLTEVIDRLDALLSDHFFPAREDGADPRVCPACHEGRLGLRLGKTGGFIGCSRYPDCRYTRPLTTGGGDADPDGAADYTQPKILGDDPVTGLQVTLRKGPYGIYVQLGEGAAKGEKPKRASLPPTMKPADVDLASACALLSLPRELGPHPETGLMILAGLGRFGPYLKHGPAYKSLTKDDDVLTVGMNRAVVLLAEAKTRAKTEPMRVLGEHDGKPVELYDGRYGVYAQHGQVRATLPKDADPEEMTLASTLALLAERGKVSAGKGKATPAKKAPAKGKATAAAAAATSEETAPAEKPKRKAPVKKAAATATATTETAPFDAVPAEKPKRKPPVKKAAAAPSGTAREWTADGGMAPPSDAPEKPPTARKRKTA